MINKNFASYYFNLNINISCIYKKAEEPPTFRYYLKVPSPEYLELSTHRQTEIQLKKFKWDKAEGLGAVLGYNNLMCIDLDRCLDFNVLNKVLKILGLPEDYEWAIRSGSGLGFHILIRSPFAPPKEGHIELSCRPFDPYEKYDDHSYYDYDPNFVEIEPDLVALLYNDKKISSFDTTICSDKKLEKIEFMWNLHSILPPSIHMSGIQYSFLNNRLPQEEPTEVSSKKLYGLFYQLCVFGKEQTEVIYVSNSRDDYYHSPISISERIKPQFPSYKIEENQNITLVFELSTNGMPINLDSPFHCSEKWPEILQIAWILTDGEKLLVLENSWISHENFSLDEKASNSLNIDKARIDQVGRSPSEVASQFIDDLSKVSTIVTTRSELKIQFLRSFLFKLGIPLKLKGKKTIDLLSKNNEDKISTSESINSINNSYYNKLSKEYNIKYCNNSLINCFLLYNKYKSKFDKNYIFTSQ